MYQAIGCVLMHPSPRGWGQSRKWAAVRISPVHCQQWTCHGGRRATEMTVPMGMAGLILFKEQAQRVSLSGRGGEGVAPRGFCYRAGAMADPELTPSH